MPYRQEQAARGDDSSAQRERDWAAAVLQDTPATGHLHGGVPTTALSAWTRPSLPAASRPAPPAKDEPFGRAIIYFTQEKVEGMMRVRMCPRGCFVTLGPRKEKSRFDQFAQTIRLRD